MRCHPFPDLFARRLAAPLLVALTFAGCQPVMSTPAIPPAGTIVPNEFPLRFRAHAFEANCYNTIGCKVIYNRKYQVQDADSFVAPPPYGPDYRNSWGGSVELGIENFPAPAEVTWKSLDGAAHQATVDIGAIFADQKILHHVPERDIPDGWAHGVEPTIILVVDDRTIEVYMQTHIATKALQEPGNRYSDYRNELVRAWAHTY